MAALMTELKEDPDTRTLFYRTVYEKMHLDLTNIKPETFTQAETNVEILKSMFEFEDAIAVFVNSAHFYNPTLNGL